MDLLKSYIGGEWRLPLTSTAAVEAINPATEEVLAKAPRASKAQLNAAVAAAKAAFPGWSKLGIDARKKHLSAIADILQANADELGRLLTQEQGKPLTDAMGEANGLAGMFRYFSKFDLAPEVLEETDKRKVELRRRPLGVVALIVPWNFPLIILGSKVPTALLAGRTIVMKPARTHPLPTVRFAELLKARLPRGRLSGTPARHTRTTDHHQQPPVRPPPMPAAARPRPLCAIAPPDSTMASPITLARPLVPIPSN